MIEGTHDGNLITNQSFVGETLGSLNGKTFVEVNLQDYLGNAITPTSAKLRVVNSYGTTQQNIVNGSEFIIGHHSQGGVRADAIIENGLIKIIFNTLSTAANIVDYMGTIEFQEVTTTDKTYTEFKII